MAVVEKSQKSLERQAVHFSDASSGVDRHPRLHSFVANFSV